MIFGKGVGNKIVTWNGVKWLKMINEGDDKKTKGMDIWWGGGGG